MRKRRMYLNRMSFSRTAVVVSLASVFALLSLGCAGSETSPPVDQAPATRTPPSASENEPARLCGPREAARLVAGFLSAVNRGDRQALARFVGKEFVAYSMLEGHVVRPSAPATGGRFTVARRSNVLSYLHRRHKHGENQRLLVIEVNERYGRGRAGATIHVRRTADDLASLGIRHRLAGAKIEIDCRRQAIIVWNMVMPREPRPNPPDCRRPKWWTGARTILACRSSRRERVVFVSRS